MVKNNGVVFLINFIMLIEVVKGVMIGILVVD